MHLSNFILYFLSKQFQKADSDLNYISLRLETEFSQQFAENGQDQVYQKFLNGLEMFLL